MSDNDTVERLRAKLEREALETVGGWLNTNPEHALALVRLANEVRGPNASGARESVLVEVIEALAKEGMYGAVDVVARLRSRKDGLR